MYFDWTSQNCKHSPNGQWFYYFSQPTFTDIIENAVEVSTSTPDDNEIDIRRDDLSTEKSLNDNEISDNNAIHNDNELTTIQPNSPSTTERGTTSRESKTTTTTTSTTTKPIVTTTTNEPSSTIINPVPTTTTTESTTTTIEPTTTTEPATTTESMTTTESTTTTTEPTTKLTSTSIELLTESISTTELDTSVTEATSISNETLIPTEPNVFSINIEYETDGEIATEDESSTEPEMAKTEMTKPDMMSLELDQDPQEFFRNRHDSLPVLQTISPVREKNETKEILNIADIEENTTTPPQIMENQPIELSNGKISLQPNFDIEDMERDEMKQGISDELAEEVLGEEILYYYDY